MKLKLSFRVDSDVHDILVKKASDEHSTLSFIINRYLRLSFEGNDSKTVSKVIVKVPHEEKVMGDTGDMSVKSEISGSDIRKLQGRIEELKEEINEQERLIATYNYSSQIAVDARRLKAELLVELNKKQREKLLLGRGY